MLYTCQFNILTVSFLSFMSEMDARRWEWTDRRGPDWPPGATVSTGLSLQLVTSHPSFAFVHITPPHQQSEKNTVLWQTGLDQSQVNPGPVPWYLQLICIQLIFSLREKRELAKPRDQEELKILLMKNERLGDLLGREHRRGIMWLQYTAGVKRWTLGHWQNS